MDIPNHLYIKGFDLDTPWPPVVSGWNIGDHAILQFFNSTAETTDAGASITLVLVLATAGSFTVQTKDRTGGVQQGFSWFHSG